MRTRTKFILWLSPLFLIALEVLCLAIICSGLALPWKFVGNPSEKIARIVGYQYVPQKIYIFTVSGEIYSLYYGWGGSDSWPSPLEWVKEKDIHIQPDPDQNVNCGSSSPPLLFGEGIASIIPPVIFWPKQVYRFGFNAVEFCNPTWFALSDDGNLWVWDYKNGLCAYLSIVIALPLFPLEILAYLLALLIGLVIFLMKKRRRRV
jgi:hypothetical protein